MAAKLGHLALEIKPKIHEIIKLELKISLVVQSACFYHFLFRFESISKMKGFEGKIVASISVAILIFSTNFNISRLMCKEERRWGSLKRGITLHLSMILKKVNLLNFFF